MGILLELPRGALGTAPEMSAESSEAAILAAARQILSVRSLVEGSGVLRLHREGQLRGELVVRGPRLCLVRATGFRPNERWERPVEGSLHGVRELERLAQLLFAPSTEALRHLAELWLSDAAARGSDSAGWQWSWDPVGSSYPDRLPFTPESLYDALAQALDLEPEDELDELFEVFADRAEAALSWLRDERGHWVPLRSGGRSPELLDPTLDAITAVWHERATAFGHDVAQPELTRLCMGRRWNESYLLGLGSRVIMLELSDPESRARLARRLWNASQVPQSPRQALRAELCPVRSRIEGCTGFAIYSDAGTPPLRSSGNWSHEALSGAVARLAEKLPSSPRRRGNSVSSGYSLQVELVADWGEQLILGVGTDRPSRAVAFFVIDPSFPIALAWASVRGVLEDFPALLGPRA